MRQIEKLVRDAAPHLQRKGPQTEAWLTWLDLRHNAVGHLVDRLLERDSAAALAAIAALWPYWSLRGHLTEGRAYLERAVRIEGPERALALKGLGTIAFRQGDLAVAETAYSERHSIVEADAQVNELADALCDQARVALRRGDAVAARRLAERAYLAALTDTPQSTRGPLHMRAAAARIEGRLDEARRLYLDSRELAERAGDRAGVAGEDHNLGHVALRGGNPSEARRRFAAAREWIFKTPNAYLRPYAFLDAAVMALHDGELERSTQLLARADRSFSEAGAIADPDDQLEFDAAHDRLRQELGPRFATIWADGYALSDAEALALAA